MSYVPVRNQRKQRNQSKKERYTPYPYVAKNKPDDDMKNIPYFTYGVEWDTNFIDNLLKDRQIVLQVPEQRTSLIQQS